MCVCVCDMCVCVCVCMYMCLCVHVYLNISLLFCEILNGERFPFITIPRAVRGTFISWRPFLDHVVPLMDEWGKSL